MKTMKKISIVLFALFVILCFGIIDRSYAAISCNISLAGNGTVTEGKPITVEVKVSNINSAYGLLALGGVLEYDKTKLEYNSMSTGSGTWAKPSYNSSNGKLVTDSEGEKGNGTVFKITFTAKKGVSGNAFVTLKNISVADIDEEIKLGNATKTISIQSENTGSQGGNTGNQGGTNQGSSNNGSSNQGGSTGNQGSSTTNKGTTTNKNNTGNKTNKPTSTVNGEAEEPKETMDLEQREEEEIGEQEENNKEDEKQEEVNLVEGKKKDNSLLFVLIGILVVLIILIIIFIVLGKLRDKNTKKIGNGIDKDDEL